VVTWVHGNPETLGYFAALVFIYGTFFGFEPWSVYPASPATMPTTALHFGLNHLTLPEGIATAVLLGSWVTTVAYTPEERTNLPPSFGFDSILQIKKPSARFL